MKLDILGLLLFVTAVPIFSRPVPVQPSGQSSSDIRRMTPAERRRRSDAQTDAISRTFRRSTSFDARPEEMIQGADELKRWFGDYTKNYGNNANEALRDLNQWKRVWLLWGYRI